MRCTIRSVAVEDRLERHDQRQQAERERIEGLQVAHDPDVDENPDREPDQMRDRERRRAGGARDHPRDPLAGRAGRELVILQLGDPLDVRENPRLPGRRPTLIHGFDSRSRSHARVGTPLAFTGCRRTLTMGVLGWILFGLVVGVVAKFLTPGRDPGGFFVTILIGIIGAMLGGFIGRGLGWYGEGDPVGFVMAVVGSIILLVLFRLASRRHA
jgi:uncharacterized membrane protein YeaQ/YmgE (transglycosylase-associated protein family)